MPWQRAYLKHSSQNSFMDINKDEMRLKQKYDITEKEYIYFLKT